VLRVLSRCPAVVDRVSYFVFRIRQNRMQRMAAPSDLTVEVQ
jgi:hypothetical protein